VLAVNYPGSTGRGAAYEARFTPAALADCVRAVWSYLRENGVDTVVSWSVSSGITVQRAVLDARVPLSAIVDQSAWGRSTVPRDGEARAIPVFTIRGRHDPAGPTERVDFWYPGGHDLTLADDFAALFDVVAPFLARARPVSLGEPDVGTNAVVLDARAADADAATAFELATHLQRACLAERAVVVVPAGVPGLGGPAARADRREHDAPERAVRILVRAMRPQRARARCERSTSRSRRSGAPACRRARARRGARAPPPAGGRDGPLRRSPCAPRRRCESAVTRAFRAALSLAGLLLVAGVLEAIHLGGDPHGFSEVDGRALAYAATVLLATAAAVGLVVGSLPRASLLVGLAWGTLCVASIAKRRYLGAPLYPGTFFACAKSSASGASSRIR
jgi:hypothetical protein